MLSFTCAGKMISPAAYELYGEEGIKLHPVGTGPFEFESYEPSISLTYKAFRRLLAGGPALSRWRRDQVRHR